MILRMVLYAPIIGIGALTKLTGSSMEWIIAVAVLTIIGFMILLLVVVMPKFQKIQKLIDKLNMVSREILTGIPVIRAFDTAKHEEERFDDANRDWLHCVAEHRKRDLFSKSQNDWNEFDIIAGKIANDTTNQVLTTYINGLYGEVGSDLADETAIRLLFPNKLSDQICFKTEKSLKMLSFVEAMEVVIDESK